MIDRSMVIVGIIVFLVLGAFNAPSFFSVMLFVSAWFNLILLLTFRKNTFTVRAHRDLMDEEQVENINQWSKDNPDLALFMLRAVDLSPTDFQSMVRLMVEMRYTSDQGALGYSKEKSK